ncbi:cytoskeletal protein binding protein [Elasticomyces elasticus]|nr:cytoskeletal protein binding protein [Elasticomyces elasticus]KAK4931888.1 cytoskeletal protein binding protein [Elasticomyces elasticus]
MPFLDISRALYAYTPQSPEELALLEGDLLFILEKSTTDDWWKCKKKAANEDDDEPEGLVPNNYVERVSPLYSVKALYDYSPQTDEEVGFEEGGKLECYDDGDPDWMLVGVEGGKGGYGFAPSNYLEREQQAQSAAQAPVMSTQRELAPPPSMPIRSRPAAEEAIPGEADYPDPGLGPSPSPDPTQQQHNPAAGLAAIIAQRTGHQSPSSDRALASPPLPSRSRPQYTPDQSDDDEPPPPMPTRPRSQQTPQPTPRIASQPQQSPRQISSYTPPGFAPPADDDYENPSQQFTPSRLANSPSGAFHLYNIHETISHIGKNKKLPTVLGINIPRGLITIAPEKSKDGPTQEWTAEKLTHYSIEGKHVFVELVRPSRSVDFHAGAKDTAKEIVGMLGELAGWQRGGGGFDEVLSAAETGTGGKGKKRGRMLYEFMAQGDDEVTVAVDDEVLVLDDKGSEEWWKVRRVKNGREGVVPSSYVEVLGRVEGGGDGGVPGLRDARGTVEFNRSEEERLARQAAGGNGKRDGGVPARGSSLAEDGGERGQRRSQQQRSEGAARRQGSGTTDSAPAKSKPKAERLRTWTDRSGTFKVEAEFIGLREGKIHLHKTNGVKIAVPVNKMAVEDLEYVEEKTGKSLDEDKPLSDIKRRNTERQKKRDEEGGRDSSKTPVKRGGGAGASVVEGNGYDWFDFFLGCGVNPQICERYASAFARDQMGVEVLPDVNEQLLRTLGLKEGDILRVMKFLDKKFGRGQSSLSGPPLSPGLQQDDSIMPVNGSAGGLFSGKDGVLRNNTARKGRPAPPVLANDIVDESAFRAKVEESPARREDARATPLAGAPARQATGGGFEDDAWDVKPARTQAMAAVQGQGFSAEAPKAVEAPRVVQQLPKLNDDLALLAMPLQPAVTGTVAPAAPPPVQVQAPVQQQQQQQQAPPAAAPQQQQGADQALFDKIAALAPARQRPQPPAITQLQQSGGTGLAPPPRAASAPGFNPQQGVYGGQFGPLALQPQLTGYQPQTQQGMYGQQTGFNPQQQQQMGMGGGFQPQMTGVQQSMQQSFPALQPQPTGMAFAPQSQFGQLAAGQQYGVPQQQPQQQQQMGMQQGFHQQGFQQQLPQQTGFGQAMVNGSSTGSPFADPPRMPFQALPSGLQNQFAPQPQQTGFQQQPQQTGFQQQQPNFNISQPTGLNGFGGQQQQYAQQPPPPPVPQLPPQQTGGVFGPAAPLVPQKTGPPPPVRFGVQPAASKLMPQATGRANLGRATPQNPFGF